MSLINIAMYNYSFVMPHRFHAWSMLVLVSIFVSFARFMIQIIFCYLHHFMSICWKWLTRIMYTWLYYFKSTWIMLTFVLIKSLNWQLWLHYALLCQGKVISGFLLRINTIPTIKMKSSIYEYINIRKFVFFFKKVLDTLFSESPWYGKTISWPGLFQGEYSDALAASTN